MPRLKVRHDESAVDSPEVTDLKAKLAAAESENTRLRNVAPVTRNVHALEAAEIPTAKLGEATMASAGAPKIEHSEIQVPDGPVTKVKADMLAFMEELVTVEVHNSGEKYAEPVVPIWNDGRIQCFPRGVPITCKRKFVEVLARSRPVSFGNIEYIDAQGNKAVKWPKSSGLKYPFAVIEDHARGRDWLRKILSEA